MIEDETIGNRIQRRRRNRRNQPVEEEKVEEISLS